MTDLTIDVQVLMYANSQGDDSHRTSSFDLAERLTREVSWKLALDKKKRIETQYLKKLRGEYGQYWIQRLAGRDKVKYVQTSPLKHSHKGIFVKLQEKGFVSNKNEDLKYVETAAASSCHLVVTYDPHFHDTSKILRQIPVLVRYCEDLL